MDSSTDAPEHNSEQEPSDPWKGSCIQETFDLPVSSDWIASTMKWTGETVQSSGPKYFKGRFVDMVPRLDSGQAGFSLTWAYANHPYPQAWVDVVQWRLIDTDSGTTVEAFCKNEWGRTLYYQLKKAAKEMAAKQGEERAQSIGLKNGGRPTLLANYWAFAETLLGRQPADLLQEWGQLYEKETGKKVADLEDPAKSLREGIAGARKKYDKKLKD